jgi:hypothetical protein
MSEERMSLDESQKPTGDPGHPQKEGVREPSSMGLEIALAAVVIIAGIAAGYGWLQHDAARRMASEQAALSASLEQAKGQEVALTAKVNALTAAQAQAQEASQAKTEATKNETFSPGMKGAHRPATHLSGSRRTPVEDARWKQIRSQLGDQQQQLTEAQKQIAEGKQQIADTQANLNQAKSELEGNLQSTRTELSGDIARNHEEVVALKKKGERNYYEFNFPKSKAYHHTGPISLALRKADSKHQSCDLQMIIDDREISRKHVNLYESLTFYPSGYPLPLEVVINHIDKDSIQGYVSEPKYRPTTEQAAAGAAAPTAGAAAPTSAYVNPPAPASPDTALEHRADDAH